MTPLSCLHPQWKPAGSESVNWRKDTFRTAPDASARDREHAKAVVQWVCDNLFMIVSFDEHQLTWSCWHPMSDKQDLLLRKCVERIFIGDQRPTWTWRRGGDVALRRWEYEQHAPRSATQGPPPVRPKPEPVWAWHLSDHQNQGTEP